MLAHCPDRSPTATMRLCILIFCCLHGTCWTSRHCVYQPKTFSVMEGDSVTIPCSYTYPQHIKESQITVRWGERNGLYCSSIKKHITDGSGNINDEYKDRMSIVKPPDNNRTESLIIRGVKASDEITFCCTVTILFLTIDEEVAFYDVGTSLIIAENDELTQMEELMAVSGEEMIIPCHYPMKTRVKVQKVSWYIGDNNRCYYSSEDIIYALDRPHISNRYSLVNFPEDVSLRIHHVIDAEFSRFCCLVATSNGTMKSTFGTELNIAGPPSSAPFTVTQPHNITAHRGESVTLNCSYSRYMESDVLGVNIYWRLGNISGPYVYHPYKEMVHPSYKGRTEIKGAADLYIGGLQTSDDSMYYCFVMIRWCVKSNENQKHVQYGEGTRLIVTEPPHDFGESQLLIIVSISAVVLLVFLCVIVVILKRRGVICTKKNVPDEKKTSDNPKNEELSLEERPYCEISTKENILYSELNKTKLPERNPASSQTQQEQTVYASVQTAENKKRQKSLAQ
ncbi:uncharacterized protein [Phyllobates terribilis]|uniref:uncharacterized protein isoform X2 n=1 Tax=Phyllobates terribilis TaxID=111132 RepID=UPI003CCABAE5